MVCLSTSIDINLRFTAEKTYIILLFKVSVYCSLDWSLLDTGLMRLGQFDDDDHHCMTLITLVRNVPSWSQLGCSSYIQHLHDEED